MKLVCWICTHTCNTRFTRCVVWEWPRLTLHDLPIPKCHSKSCRALGAQCRAIIAIDVTVWWFTCTTLSLRGLNKIKYTTQENQSVSTIISHIIRLLLYDWLKCSHMTKDILPIRSSDLLLDISGPPMT